MATVNRETGVFILSRLPPDTSYEITISGNGYRSVSIGNIPVKPGEETYISDTIRLKLDPSGSPQVSPTGLTITYDTANGKALLGWQSVPLEDVRRYVVYYSLDLGSTWRRLTVIDT